MEGMEEKLGSILANPDLMQKIMTMAQSLGGSQTADKGPEPPPKPPDAPALPNIDLAALQKLSGFMGKTSIDRDQRALLSALGPYLSRERIHKLENAMRAAKMAGFAALALRQQGPQLPTGR